MSSGADVIKIEKAGGDDARGWGPPFVEDASTTFHLMNRNKKSVMLSLDEEADRACFLGLVREADVFIHNLRPGVAEKLRIEPETLLRLNPRLVYCAMSAFGHVGPLKLKTRLRAFAPGILGPGQHQRRPCGPGLARRSFDCRYGHGHVGRHRRMTALLDRERSGKGSVVRTSLFETALGWVARHAADYGATGKIPPRVGTGHNSLTPYQAFESADGPIVIAAGNHRLFAKLSNVMGHPEWSSDPRFATNADRTRNRDALLPMMEAIIRGRRGEEWVDVLENAGVPCAPINNVPQVMAHPQTHALGMLLDSGNDKLRLMGLPFSIDGQRPGFGRKAPALGEDQDCTKQPVTEAAK